MGKKKIFVVVPAFNEAGMIGQVLAKLKRLGYVTIIVVDDGSFDNTSMVARRNGAVVLRHVINRGKGAAVKTGIEAAKILGAHAAVTMDGDGQHNPDEIQTLVKALKKYDVVLGKRNMNKKYMPLGRIIANYIANFVTWLFYGVWVSDSQCGLRAYSKKSLAVIDTLNDRYEYDSEVIREIARHHLRFKEVPIQTRYNVYSRKKRYRQSFMNGINMIWRMIISS